MGVKYIEVLMVQLNTWSDIIASPKPATITEDQLRKEFGVLPPDTAETIAAIEDDSDGAWKLFGDHGRSQHRWRCGGVHCDLEGTWMVGSTRA